MSIGAETFGEADYVKLLSKERRYVDFAPLMVLAATSDNPATIVREFSEKFRAINDELGGCVDVRSDRIGQLIKCGVGFHTLHIDEYIYDAEIAAKVKTLELGLLFKDEISRVMEDLKWGHYCIDIWKENHYEVGEIIELFESVFLSSDPKKLSKLADIMLCVSMENIGGDRVAQGERVAQIATILSGWAYLYNLSPDNVYGIFPDVIEREEFAKFLKEASEKILQILNEVFLYKK